jgi:hypothetical protein
MIKLTQSLTHWLFVNHRKKLPLIILGHIELLTEEMYNEYLAWCESDEGRQYLRGGSQYKPLKAEVYFKAIAEHEKEVSDEQIE